MIHEWGMGEKLYYEPEQRDAELEINRLLEQADQQALRLSSRLKRKTPRFSRRLFSAGKLLLVRKSSISLRPML